MEGLQSNGHPFNFGSCLGTGAFGSVFQCRDLESGLDCAVKVIKKEEFSVNIDAVFKEVRILSSLKHDNIVEFRRVIELDDHILIEMELMSGGTLQSRLAGSRLADSENASVLRQILEAVHYLHLRDIVHRDLKPENVLFKSQDSASPVKITDFGLSEKFEDAIWTKSLRESCGTLAFMAPEQASSRHYSRPVDIWSCGIILYMLVTGTHPLLADEDSSKAYAQKLTQKQVWTFPSDFPPMAKDLFLRMAAFHPLDRYTAEEALRHPWITRADSDIPKTYIERLGEYNDRVRFWTLCMKMCAVAAVISPTNSSLISSYTSAVLHPPPKPKFKPKVVVSQPKDEIPQRSRAGSFCKLQSTNFTPVPSPISAKKTLACSQATFARLGVSPVQSPAKNRDLSSSRQRFFA